MPAPVSSPPLSGLTAVLVSVGRCFPSGGDRKTAVTMETASGEAAGEESALGHLPRRRSEAAAETGQVPASVRQSVSQLAG